MLQCIKSVSIVSDSMLTHSMLTHSMLTDYRIDADGHQTLASLSRIVCDILSLGGALMHSMPSTARGLEGL